MESCKGSRKGSWDLQKTFTETFKSMKAAMDMQALRRKSVWLWFSTRKITSTRPVHFLCLKGYYLYYLILCNTLLYILEGVFKNILRVLYDNPEPKNSTQEVSTQEKFRKCLIGILSKEWAISLIYLSEE